MAYSNKATISAVLPVLLLLFLFASQVAVPGVEARICRVKSSRFWGPCISDRHCAATCIKEGFSAGDCEGLRRRCLCQKPC